MFFLPLETYLPNSYFLLKTIGNGLTSVPSRLFPAHRQVYSSHLHVLDILSARLSLLFDFSVGLPDSLFSIIFALRKGFSRQISFLLSLPLLST